MAADIKRTSLWFGIFEYDDDFRKMERAMGFEPTTPTLARLGKCYSAVSLGIPQYSYCTESYSLYTPCYARGVLWFSATVVTRW